MELDLNKIRQEINSIDDEISALFEKRMLLAKDVAEYKRQNDMAVYDRRLQQAGFLQESVRKSRLETGWNTEDPPGHAPGWVCLPIRPVPASPLRWLRSCA